MPGSRSKERKLLQGMKAGSYRSNSRAQAAEASPKFVSRRPTTGGSRRLGEGPPDGRSLATQCAAAIISKAFKTRFQAPSRPGNR